MLATLSSFEDKSTPAAPSAPASHPPTPQNHSRTSSITSITDIDDGTDDTTDDIDRDNNDGDDDDGEGGEGGDGFAMGEQLMPMNPSKSGRVSLAESIQLPNSLCRSLQDVVDAVEAVAPGQSLGETQHWYPGMAMGGEGGADDDRRSLPPHIKTKLFSVGRAASRILREMDEGGLPVGVGGMGSAGGRGSRGGRGGRGGRGAADDVGEFGDVLHVLLADIEELLPQLTSTSSGSSNPSTSSAVVSHADVWRQLPVELLAIDVRAPVREYRRASVMKKAMPSACKTRTATIESVLLVCHKHVKAASVSHVDEKDVRGLLENEHILRMGQEREELEVAHSKAVAEQERAMALKADEAWVQEVFRDIMLRIEKVKRLLIGLDGAVGVTSMSA